MTTNQNAIQALASETRYRIINTLKGKELAVEDIASELRMTHSAIGHQLMILKAMDVLQCEKQGRYVRYRFADTPVAKEVKRVHKPN